MSAESAAMNSPDVCFVVIPEASLLHDLISAGVAGMLQAYSSTSPSHTTVWIEPPEIGAEASEHDDSEFEGDWDNAVSVSRQRSAGGTLTIESVFKSELEDAGM
jgi:hypothetical protein